MRSGFRYLFTVMVSGLFSANGWDEIEAAAVAYCPSVRPLFLSSFLQARNGWPHGATRTLPRLITTSWWILAFASPRPSLAFTGVTMEWRLQANLSQVVRILINDGWLRKGWYSVKRLLPMLLYVNVAWTYLQQRPLSGILSFSRSPTTTPNRLSVVRLFS